MPVIHFRNYTASLRKPLMTRFGLFQASAAADLAVIESIALDPIGITGTQDGSNVTFTVSDAVGELYKNGLRQATPGDYSVTGTTLTWVVAPLADDIILGYPSTE